MNVLFLQNRVLFPADAGGKLRTLNVVRHLARWHNLTYVCSARPEDEPYLPQMQALGLRVEAVPRPAGSWGKAGVYAAAVRNLFSSLPLSIAKNYDPAMRARVQALLAQEPFDLIVCDFLQTALCAVGLPGPPRLLFQHNVEAEIFRRHAETNAGLWGRYFASQWRRMADFEAAVGKAFDLVVAVSEKDRAYFEDAYGWPNVRAIDTGVDTTYFQPASTPGIPGRVLFLGSLDWMPNQQGVTFFVQHVWPAIRARHPRATFQIVGRHPSRDVRKLHGLDGIEVVGTVPDVRPYLAEAEVVVVPLLVGGGTRLKIFEAMAAGKAVVSTTIGCEGLPVEPGKHLLVADEPAELAGAVGALLDSPASRATLTGAALALVVEKYGAETVARQFEALCQQASQENRIRPLLSGPRPVPRAG